MPQQLSYRIQNRLYLGITNRCTLECSFCPQDPGQLPPARPRPSPRGATGDRHHPRRHRWSASWAEVVFSGVGEPTLRLNTLLAVAGRIKANGHVRVSTGGLANLVHDRDVLPALSGLVDILSVSMNPQDKATYERHCRPTLPGSFDAILAFLREAPRHVPQVTATAIAGLPNVDLPACERIAREAGATFRMRPLVEAD